MSPVVTCALLCFDHFLLQAPAEVTPPVTLVRNLRTLFVAAAATARTAAGTIAMAAATISASSAAVVS